MEDQQDGGQIDRKICNVEYDRIERDLKRPEEVLEQHAQQDQIKRQVAPARNDLCFCQPRVKIARIGVSRHDRRSFPKKYAAWTLRASA